MGTATGTSLTHLDPASKHHLAKKVGLIAGVGLLYLFSSMSASQFADAAPLLSVGISWIWFILPGVLLTQLILRRESWWQYIPLSFALSVGILTPPTVAAILLRVSLDTFLYLHTAALVFSALLLLLRRERPAASPENRPTLPENPARKGIDKINLFLLMALIFIVGSLAFLAIQWPMTGDDVAGLPIFVEVLSQDRITGTEPFHGSGVPVTPRNELIVATYLEILTNKVSGASSTDFITNSRPIFVLLAFLSLATLLYHLLNDKRQALLLLSLWGIYLLATSQKDGMGSDFITRIFQDKFLGWLVIVPVSLLLMFWFLKSSERRYLFAFGLVTLGASLVHPITLTQVMMLSGGFGLVHFLTEPSRKALANILLIALALLINLIIPIMQYLRYTTHMPIVLAGLGEAVEFGRLSSAVWRYRLWLLDGDRFILHPAIILQPVILAAYAILPAVVARLRESYFARMVVGGMLILPLMFYVPPLAGLVGRVVTPYLIWRLAWPLPLLAVLSIGWVLCWLIHRLEQYVQAKESHASAVILFYPGLVLCGVLLAAPDIHSGLQDHFGRRSEVYSSTCQKASRVLSFLDSYSTHNTVNVLSSPALNFCIPGYVANANVVEFRGFGTINRLSVESINDSIQRVEDTSYFATASLVDDLIIGAIDRYPINIVLIEKDRLQLDLQFKYLSDQFQLFYEDSDYRLYIVHDRKGTLKIVEANTALRMKEYSVAEELFRQVLQEDPENVLAYLGLGLSQERQTEVEAAVQSYQKALSYAPQEPALHEKLASAYLVKRDFNQALTEYQRAIQLSPTRSQLYISMGKVQILLGKKTQAIESFQQFASLRMIEGSPDYYSIIGRLLQSIPLTQDLAIQYHQTAISINPHPQRYLDLARSYVLAGKNQQAMAELNKAIMLDQWNYVPHLQLGYIHLLEGRNDQAIMELETACKLNPTNVSSFILLGKSIEEKSGLDAAIQRLEELANFNQVLVGPLRSYATLMMSAGELDTAAQALDISANIQPRSAAILIAKGYVSMSAGKLDAAYAAFEQALFHSPDLISARLGLGMYYQYEADYQMETGQFLEIVQLAPTTAWIHMALADTYANQGEWQSALEEVNWAISLEPDNPDGYLARGALNQEQGMWDQAISDFEIARQLDPHNQEALISLGDINLELTDYAQAETFYQLAASFDQTSIQPRIRLADLYWMLGREAEAAALEKQLVKLSPDSDLVLVRTAKSYQKQGFIEEARQIYAQVIQSSPALISAHIAFAQLAEQEDNDLNILFSLYQNMLDANQASAEAYLAAGRFFISQAQFEQAEQVLRISLTLPGITIDNYLVLSDLLARRGEWLAALKILETATAKYPVQAVGFDHLASHYLKKGDYETAQIYYDQVLRIEPGRFSAYQGKSQFALIQGDLHGAEDILQTAILKNPTSPEALLGMAEFQEMLGKIGLAGGYIQQALDIKPTNQHTLQTAALFYLRQNRLDEARQMLVGALSLPGSMLDVYLQLGNLENASLRTEDAMHWYQAATDVNGSDVRPYLAMADLYKSSGQLEKELNALTTAFQIEPVNSSVNMALGDLYKRMGYYDYARRYYEWAYQMDFYNEKPLLALAQLSTISGDLERATTQFEHAIHITPTSLPAYQALVNLYLLKEDRDQAIRTISEGVQNTDDKPEAYLTRALLYEMLENWDFAREDYENAWNFAPYSKPAGLKLVNYLFRRNEPIAAFSVLGQLEDLIGPDADIQVAYGNYYLSQANWSEAKDAFRQSTQLDPALVQGYLGLARVSQIQADLDSAIQLYKVAQLHCPDDPALRVNLGEVHRSRGEYQEALIAYQQAIDLNPLNLAGLANLDQISQLLGDPVVDLLPYVQHALATPSSQAMITIAKIYQLRSEWELAHSWLERAIRLDPYSSENWFHLGNYYLSMAQWEDALHAYEQGLSFQPGSLSGLLGLGTVQETMRQFDAAMDSYQRAIDNHPTYLDGYLSLAWLLSGQGQYEQAIAVLQQGIDLIPGDYRGYLTLGDLEISNSMDHAPQAEKAYQSGLGAFPGNPDLLVHLGDLYTKYAMTAWDALKTAKQLEQYSENRYLFYTSIYEAASQKRQQSRFMIETVDAAKRMYDLYKRDKLTAQKEYEQLQPIIDAAARNYSLALALNPTNEAALIGLGRIQLAQGLKEAAIVYFQQAYDLNPFSSFSLLNLGILYLEVGQTGEARQILEKLVDIEPGNSIAQTALSMTYQDLESLTISQAAVSVERTLDRMEVLVGRLRNRNFPQ